MGNLTCLILIWVWRIFLRFRSFFYSSEKWVFDMAVVEDCFAASLMFFFSFQPNCVLEMNWAVREC